MLVTKVLKAVENISDKSACWLNEAIKNKEFDDIKFILNGIGISHFHDCTIGQLINQELTGEGVWFSRSGSSNQWYYNMETANA